MEEFSLKAKALFHMRMKKEHILRNIKYFGSGYDWLYKTIGAENEGFLGLILKV